MALLGVSPDGTILSCTNEIETLLGHKSHELTGKEISFLFGNLPWNTSRDVELIHKHGNSVRVRVNRVLSEESVNILDLRPFQKKKCLLLVRNGEIIHAYDSYDVFGFSETEILQCRVEELFVHNEEHLYITGIRKRCGSIVPAEVLCQEISLDSHSLLHISIACFLISE